MKQLATADSAILTLNKIIMQHNSAVEKEHVTKKYVILRFLFDVCVKVLQWENLLGSSHLQN
jgi:hypothetical protein